MSARAFSSASRETCSNRRSDSDSDAMHLVRKSRRGHLRRFAHFVALAAYNFFRGFVNLRRAVLHISPPIMIQLRSQQAGHFRRPVAQLRSKIARPSSPSNSASCCALFSDTTPKPSAAPRKSRAASRCCAVESLLRSSRRSPGPISRFPRALFRLRWATSAGCRWCWCSSTSGAWRRSGGWAAFASPGMPDGTRSGVCWWRLRDGDQRQPGTPPSRWRMP